jgi:hypothetical protein
MRDVIERRTKERHLLAAAALCRAHGMKQLKLYMMLGLPGETDADIDELARFSLELARVAPRVALGIAPFVAKRNTPLDGAPFEAIESIDAKLARLRAALKGRVVIRPTSPKWAWIEYRLAQGGMEAGRAAAHAARAGGRFADWKAALAEVPAPAPAPFSRQARRWLDLDQGPLGEAGRLNRRAGRRLARKIPGVDLVHRPEVLRSARKIVVLTTVAKDARRREHRAQVVEHARACRRTSPAPTISPVFDRADLPRAKHHPPCRHGNCLRVMIAGASVVEIVCRDMAVF